MQRKLLMYFSYLGTNYRGLQLQNRRTLPDLRTPIPELDTVQGVLEHALRKVLQISIVDVHNSSRTDAGVHALSSTAHFQVSNDAFSAYPFCPDRICQSLNFYLEKHETDIRVKRVVEVPLEFHCRRAYSRTYNYRIALAKTNDFNNCLTVLKLSPFLPISELNKAQVVTQPFDVEKVQQACRVFVGNWNFRNFATLANSTTTQEEFNHKKRKQQILTEEDLTKTIYRFSFSKAKLEEDEFDSSGYYFRDPAYNKLEFYDFHVEGSGFLRRQVRRMVGVLLGVGHGSFDSKLILHLLQNPKTYSWPPTATASQAEGLFLKSVNYKNLEVLRGPLS